MKSSQGRTDQRLHIEKMRKSQFHMVSMRRRIDETLLFLLGLALSLGFTWIQEATGANLQGLNSSYGCNAQVLPMGARHLLQDRTGSGILSHIIYFCQKKKQVMKTTTLRRVHLHQRCVGKPSGPGQSLGTPLGRCTRPRYKPCSSISIYFYALMRSQQRSSAGWCHEPRCFTQTTLADHEEGPGGPTLARERSPSTVCVHSHHHKCEISQFHVGGEGERCERTNFSGWGQTPFPKQLALPCAQPRDRTPWAGFSRGVNPSRTERSDGCVPSWSHAGQGSGLPDREQAAVSPCIAARRRGTGLCLTLPTLREPSCATSSVPRAGTVLLQAARLGGFAGKRRVVF